MTRITPQRKAQIETKLKAVWERHETLKQVLTHDELLRAANARTQAYNAVKEGDATNARQQANEYETVISELEAEHSQNDNVVPLRPEPEDDRTALAYWKSQQPGDSPYGKRFTSLTELNKLDTPAEPLLATPNGHIVIAHQRYSFVYGPWGEGKTWLLVLAAIAACRDEGLVDYFQWDFGHARGTAILHRRFYAVDQDTAVWRDSYEVVEPDRWNADQMKLIRDVSLERLTSTAESNPKHSLVIHDTVTNAGGASNKVEEATAFAADNVKLYLAEGIGVMNAGHEPKNRETKGPLGSQAAPADCDTLIRVACGEGQTIFNRHYPGGTTGTSHKDRFGDHHPTTGGTLFELHGEPHGDGLLNLVLKDPPGSKADDAQRAQAHSQTRSEQSDPAQLLYGFLLRQGGEFWGFNDLLAQGPIKGAPTLRKAIKQLKAEGVLKVTPNPPGKVHYKLIG